MIITTTIRDVDGSLTRKHKTVKGFEKYIVQQSGMTLDAWASFYWDAPAGKAMQKVFADGLRFIDNWGRVYTMKGEQQ